MINEFVLNGTGDGVDGSDVPIIGYGAIVSFEQIVGKIYLGRIARFSQVINFHETASGSMVDFEQNVKSTSSGRIIYFEQYIL